MPSSCGWSSSGMRIGICELSLVRVRVRVRVWVRVRVNLRVKLRVRSAS